MRIPFQGWMLPAAVIGLQLLPVAPVSGQGFGKIKKKVVLHRKLPSAVRLTVTSFDVKAASATPTASPQIAVQLAAMLAAELAKNDPGLRQDDAKPELLITCTITNLSTPPANPPNRPQPQNAQRQNKVQRNVAAAGEQTTTVKGSLNVSYQARDLKAGRTVDSSNITATVSEQIDTEGGTLAESKKIGNLVKKPMRLIPKKKDDENTPTTLGDVQQILLKRAVSQIAARLVNTNEAIEVYLARGKLDDYNKAAEAGLWNRALESWETMTPLPNKEDDSYRLYNIGVAYEALAYKAEDMKTTKKFFDQAAISYGKAIDANPGEKYFLDPQDRIQTALAHYKKLETQAAAPAAAPAPAPPPPVVVAAPAKPAPKAPKVATTTATATPPPPTAPKSNGATLTNAKLIQLVKAGLDEENLAATIRDAPSVNFDLSPDGQLFLLQGGLRPRLITVMREKMKGAPRPAAPASKTNTAQNK